MFRQHPSNAEAASRPRAGAVRGCAPSGNASAAIKGARKDGSRETLGQEQFPHPNTRAGTPDRHFILSPTCGVGEKRFFFGLPDRGHSSCLAVLQCITEKDGLAVPVEDFGRGAAAREFARMAVEDEPPRIPHQSANARNSACISSSTCRGCASVCAISSRNNSR